MYLWKVKCSTARQWVPKRNPKNPLPPMCVFLQSQEYQDQMMKPVYTEYYITCDRGEDTLREAVLRSMRDPSTIKKVKLVGDIRNMTDYVSSHHFHDCLNAAHKRAIDDGHTIQALKQQVAELKAEAAKKPNKTKRKKS